MSFSAAFRRQIDLADPIENPAPVPPQDALRMGINFTPADQVEMDPEIQAEAEMNLDGPAVVAGAFYEEEPVAEAPAPSLAVLAAQHQIDQPGEAPPQTESAFREWLAKLTPLGNLQGMAQSLKPYDDRLFQRPYFEVAFDGRIIAHDRANGSTAYMVLNPETKVEKQLCAKLGLPGTLPEKLRELDCQDDLANILTKASQRGPDYHLFRGNDEGGFAALTPSYLRLDNRDVLGPMLNLLPAESWAARRINLGDPTFSSFELVHTGSARMVNGDRLMMSLTGSNSEDGSGTLNIALSILRLACLNGLLIPMHSFIKAKIIHRGSRQSALGAAGLSPKVLDLIPSEDGIWTAASQALDLIELAQGNYAPAAYERGHLTLGIADAFGMSFREREAILNNAGGGAESVWDWTNALTKLHTLDGIKPRRVHEINGHAWNFLRAGVRDADYIQGIALRGRSLEEKELSKIR